LLRNLIDIASKGGNYLLNIGPDSHGVVPSAEVERLQQVGKWMAVNGEAVYSTGATLFGPEAGSFSTTEQDPKTNGMKFVSAWEWRSTTKPDRVYIEIFKWPTGALHLEKMPRKVTGAYLLADKSKRPLKVTQNGQTVEVALPPGPIDPIATVVVLKTAM
jgi:alpha-L-fucosidase